MLSSAAPVAIPAAAAAPAAAGPLSPAATRLDIAFEDDDADVSDEEEM